MSDVAKKVETLMEAMPYLEKYQGKVIVIKYGGNAMINDELKDAVLHDVVLLKLLGLKPVLSHGGGPGINKMLEKLDIPVQFINGLRYTSEDIMCVVEMVLVGQVNTELVGKINQIGGKAVGLSGVSGDIYHCHKRSEELGFVGDIDYVNAGAVNAMLDAGFIPVIAPVGTDGAFVEIAPGKDGLVHISKLDKKRVEKVEDVVTVGDMIWVKFMEIDEKGRWNLSRKDALIEIEAQQAAAKEQ